MVETLEGAELADGARASVVVAREESAWTADLRLQVDGGSTVRSLEAETCAGLADAVALVTEMALVRSEDPEEPSEPPPPETPPRPEPSVPVVVSAARADPPPPRRPVARVVRAVVGVGDGALPHASAVMSLAVSAAWHHAQLEGAVTWWLPQDHVFDRASGGGARFGLVHGDLAGCGVATPWRLRIPLCGGLPVGDIRATGFGLEGSQTTHRLWLAARAGTGLEWRPTRVLALWLGADLYVPFLRRAFVIQELGTVHRSAPVAGTGLVGLSLNFDGRVEGRWGK